MRCPFCKEDNDKVVDSRGSGEGYVIRRRRECLACGKRYTTYERIEEAALRVVKKDGTREPYDRRKLLGGLERACEKRPIPGEELERICDEVEREMHEAHDREVSSREIGELLMRRLRALDQVAYVRFASVYREFKDVTEFLEELRPLLGADGDDA